MYYEIYSILTGKTKEEVKEYIKNDFEINDEDFEQLFLDLLTYTEKTKDEWLSE
jgi:hypothetical protein